MSKIRGNLAKNNISKNYYLKLENLELDSRRQCTELHDGKLKYLS